MAVPIEWLRKVNEEFREAGIEQRRRPWEALSRYSLDFKASFMLSSSIATEIFEWFEAQSKPGAHHIGSLFESVYYFDAEFWLVSIPIMYGTVRMNAIDCLLEMPPALKAELISANKSAWDFLIFWADCVDYGIGISELLKRTDLNKFGLQLMAAGDQELRSAVSLLKEKRPDSRAILPCRMATEIFLKAYIALKEGLTEKQAKALSHNLENCFDRFIEVSGYSEWAQLKSKLKVFPPIHERYNEQSQPMKAVWEGFAFAQSIGTIIVRENTGRDTLSQVLSSNNDVVKRTSNFE